MRADCPSSRAGAWRAVAGDVDDRAIDGVTLQPGSEAPDVIERRELHELQPLRHTGSLPRRHDELDQNACPRALCACSDDVPLPRRSRT